MKRQRTFQMVLSAMFIAMIILQSFVPFLGNLPLVILDITIIHITVIVGGIVLGPQAGFLLGFTWGMFVDFYESIDFCITPFINGWLCCVVLL